MRRVLPILLGSIIMVACAQRQQSVVVGSKNFTESVILGELLAQTLEDAGCRVDRRLNMGGTFVADRAIQSGSLDAYVEYSGTALTAILERPAMNDREVVNRTIEKAYADRGLRWGPSLGFENTFAMLVRKDDATRFGLASIEDLRKVEDSFQPGFGYEFVERPDGYHGLLAAYGLEFAKAPRTMDLGLTYKALASGEVDLIAGNSTDGLIESLGLAILDDDRHYFPPYDAAIVMSPDLATKCARGPAALRALAGSVDDRTMRQMNYEVDGKKRPPADVVRELRARLPRNR